MRQHEYETKQQQTITNKTHDPTFERCNLACHEFYRAM